MGNKTWEEELEQGQNLVQNETNCILPNLSTIFQILVHSRTGLDDILIYHLTFDIKTVVALS